MTDLERYDGKTARNRAMLEMRRKGLSFDDIAEQLGMEDRFEVIDALNEIYANRRSVVVGGRTRIDPEEVIDYIDGKLDELITTFHEKAINEGDTKAGRLTITALKTKAELHGAITPPQVNINLNTEKPWERVFKASMVETTETIEGEIVE